jgi:uncharacterized protein
LNDTATEPIMFVVTYTIVLAAAALPLAITLLSNKRVWGDAFAHRLYRSAAYLVAAIVCIICLEVALRISLEAYWFGELGQSHRFWLSIEYRIEIFLAFLIVLGLYFSANLQALRRLFPIVPRTAPWLVGFVLAGFLGLAAAPLWMPLMRFRGAAIAGVNDPVFGKDLSFYLLTLPLYDDILEIVIAVLFATIALWVIVGAAVLRGPNEFVGRADCGGKAYAPRSIVVLRSNGRAAWGAWLRHGMILAAMLCVASAASRFLARYHLVADGHSSGVAGASFVDVNFWLPAYSLMIACWLAAALVLILAAVTPRFRGWLLIRRSHWLAPIASNGKS